MRRWRKRHDCCIIHWQEPIPLLLYCQAASHWHTNGQCNSVHAFLFKVPQGVGPLPGYMLTWFTDNGMEQWLVLQWGAKGLKWDRSLFSRHTVNHTDIQGGVDRKRSGLWRGVVGCWWPHTHTFNHFYYCFSHLQLQAIADIHLCTNYEFL